eukprot:614518_1
MWQTKELSVEIRNCATIRKAFNRTLSREVKDIVLGIWEPTYWEDLDYTLTSNKPLQLTLTTLEGALVNPGFVYYKYTQLYDEYKQLLDMNVIDRTEWRNIKADLDAKWALIESPIHYAVFLIDPRFRDQDILFERQEKGEYRVDGSSSDEVRI